MATDDADDYERYAAPRCQECGSRYHTHLRCPGIADVVPLEPATMATGTVLIEWGGDGDEQRSIGRSRS